MSNQTLRRCKALMSRVAAVLPVRQEALRLPLLLLTLGVALTLAADLVLVTLKGGDARGYEFEQVGRAIAQGEGFSFPGPSRWLFDEHDPPEARAPEAFFPTAWVEPVGAWLLGFLYWSLGEAAPYAATAAAAVAVAAMLVVVFALGNRIGGPAVGLIAAALLALNPTVHFFTILNTKPTMLAALLMALVGLGLLRLMERPSLRASLILGAAIGVAMLVQAGSLTVLPVAMLMVLVSGGPRRLDAWRCALAIPLAACLVVMPWMVRNARTFDTFVPIRSGAGQIAYIGNRSVAEAIQPELAPPAARAALPWSEPTAYRAVQRLLNLGDRVELYRYSAARLRGVAPPAFAHFNEAERDAVYMQEAKAFMRAQPALVAELAAFKALAFLSLAARPQWRPIAGAIGWLAVLGALIGGRDRRVIALTLMALAYATPVIMTSPFVARYRLPEEPLLVVLASFALVAVVQRFGRWFRLVRSHAPPRLERGLR